MQHSQAKVALPWRTWWQPLDALIILCEKELSCATLKTRVFLCVDACPPCPIILQTALKCNSYWQTSLLKVCIKSLVCASHQRFGAHRRTIKLRSQGWCFLGWSCPKPALHIQDSVWWSPWMGELLPWNRMHSWYTIFCNLVAAATH